MMELRGDIPGLLRRGSPMCDLFSQHHKRIAVSAKLDTKGCVPVVYDDRPDDVIPCHPSNMQLDTSDPTGRFHARLWLAERGHDVGNEDRAEVLAWSVLSVWRGGRALPVAGAWDGSGERWVKGRWTVAHVTHTGWWVGGECGHETGDVAKAAADATLLALGWALTNTDGTLTLPPLPGAK